MLLSTSFQNVGKRNQYYPPYSSCEEIKTTDGHSLDYYEGLSSESFDPLEIKKGEIYREIPETLTPKRCKLSSGRTFYFKDN